MELGFFSFLSPASLSSAPPLPPVVACCCCCCCCCCVCRSGCCSGCCIGGPLLPPVPLTSKSAWTYPGLICRAMGERDELLQPWRTSTGILPRHVPLRIEPTQGAQGRSPFQPGSPGAPVLLGPFWHIPLVPMSIGRIRALFAGSRGSGKTLLPRDGLLSCCCWSYGNASICANGLDSLHVASVWCFCCWRAP